MIRRTADLEHQEPDYRQVFSLMGEQVRFETNMPEILQVAEQAFGRYPPVAAASRPPLVVRLFCRDAGPEPHPLPAEAQRRPIHQIEDYLFSIHYGRANLAVADARQGFAFGYVTPAVAADRAFLRVTFIEALALAMLGPARGYVAIHAACVVKDGACLLLPAPAGTGKSTLAYACARRGYQVLAEDAARLATAAAPLRLWGIPWQLHLLPNTKLFFPELANQQPCLQMNGEWKLEIDLEASFPGSTVTAADPGAIVLLERPPGGGHTQLESLPPAEVLAAFSVLWPWRIGWTEDMERAVQQLLMRPVYRLTMNGSPDEAVAALDQLLETERGLRVG